MPPMLLAWLLRQCPLFRLGQWSRQEAVAAIHTGATDHMDGWWRQFDGGKCTDVSLGVAEDSGLLRLRGD